MTGQKKLLGAVVRPQLLRYVQDPLNMMSALPSMLCQLRITVAGHNATSAGESRIALFADKIGLLAYNARVIVRFGV